MFDYRIILIILMTIVLMCVLTSDSTSTPSSPTPPKYQPDLEITITDKTFNQMIDIVTNYSLIDKTRQGKYAIIFMATFHLFLQNFSAKQLDYLDQKLANYKYVPHDYVYPKGDRFENLQKVIISNMTRNLRGCDREFVTDRVKDRVIIRAYLNKMFRELRIQN